MASKNMSTIVVGIELILDSTCDSEKRLKSRVEHPDSGLKSSSASLTESQT